MVLIGHVVIVIGVFKDNAKKNFINVGLEFKFKHLPKLVDLKYIIAFTFHIKVCLY